MGKVHELGYVGITAADVDAWREYATNVLGQEVAYDSDADILRAVEAGATGYLLKDTPREELFKAIRATARGDSVLSPSVASKLIGRARGPMERALSAREIEVLALVARGVSNKIIAKDLRISEATVKTHLLHIFAKLGVDDRTAAVTAAMEKGVLRLVK